MIIAYPITLPKSITETAAGLSLWDQPSRRAPTRFAVAAGAAPPAMPPIGPLPPEFPDFERGIKEFVKALLKTMGLRREGDRDRKGVA